MKNELNVYHVIERIYGEYNKKHLIFKFLNKKKDSYDKISRHIVAKSKDDALVAFQTMYKCYKIGDKADLYDWRYYKYNSIVTDVEFEVNLENELSNEFLSKNLSADDYIAYVTYKKNYFEKLFMIKE